MKGIGGGDMAMIRREFVKHLALLAAGAAALPSQIAAFEQLYEANTRSFGERSDLIFIRDMIFGFDGVPGDVATRVSLLRGDQTLFQIALNKRATFRWVGVPELPLISPVKDLHWDIQTFAGEYLSVVRDEFVGTLGFLDQQDQVHTLTINGRQRRLIEYSL